MLSEDQQVRFTAFWTDAQPSVSQYVASLIRDQWAVRDVVQNTSMILLRKYPEYDDTQPFLPWALVTCPHE
ncbi:RNA polymerase sigma factor [Bremerella sp. P1]|uniref:RNA polymerase sigma factor n=1 Tax=Bremerella sp. P1 TaxID=3026424 RepID=UPI002368F275|nr:sigma factor [Bremerella sp. P1]WDI41525.1 sigma factor [Bremerella sp. P1]